MKRTAWLCGLLAACAAAPEETAAEQNARQLAEAQRAYAANPEDRDAAIWVGRRFGYLGRFEEAVRVYTEALARHADDPFLLRHRGHRYISLRRFDLAIDDLSRAAARCRIVPDEVEADGLPVAGRPPHSSLHFNVHYHLGLALFCSSQFRAAERAWLNCLAVCDDDESRVAVSHWLWSVRMRLGNPAGAQAVAAAITPAMDIVENTSYHQLCLLYAGNLDRADIATREGSSGAALAFGLAHHDLVSGRVEAARRQLQALAEPGGAAFGVLAAEAELRRLP